MEHQEHGLVVFQILLVFHILLVLAEQFWVEADVSRLVYTVYIAEPSGNGEVRADGRQSLVDAVDVFWLCVQ